MSQVLRFPLQPEAVAGYRIDCAELELASEQLYVDGVATPLAPTCLVLLALCRGQGALLRRDDCFEPLWPNGGIGSDEARAQIVFTLRQALPVAAERSGKCSAGAAMALERNISAASARPVRT